MPDVNQQLEELITQVRARHDELYRQVEPGPWSEVEPLMATRLEYLERVANRPDMIKPHGGHSGVSGVDDLALMFEEEEARVPTRREIYSLMAQQTRQDLVKARQWMQLHYRKVRSGPVGDTVVKAYVSVMSKRKAH